jgi:putative transposase
VQRLMPRRGLWGIAPGPRTSRAHPAHRVYPCLLRDVVVERPNQVWSTDITYIPMRTGFMFLVAILDWYSRYVLSFGLSNTLDTVLCVEALKEALIFGRPEIFNTDQGCQFTRVPFTGVLEAHEVRISMDARGRVFDNIFVERLWRRVKYEDIRDYGSVAELDAGLARYFRFYTTKSGRTSRSATARQRRCMGWSHRGGPAF